MKISEQSLYCIKKVVPPALATLHISPRSPRYLPHQANVPGQTPFTSVLAASHPASLKHALSTSFKAVQSPISINPIAFE